MATLTEGERKVISLAWQCFKTVPEVDYKKLQALGNYKTAASATSCYLAARKKMLNTPAAAVKITEGENKVLLLAWQCFKVAPTVDYKKLAQVGSYKTPASATSCYLAARKKLLTSTTTAAASNASPAVAGRKRKSATTQEENSGEAPAPKRRFKKAKQSSPDSCSHEGEDKSDEDVKTKRIKRESGDDAETEAEAAVVKREDCKDRDGGDHDEGMDHLLITAKVYLECEKTEAVSSGVSDAEPDEHHVNNS